MKIIVISIRCLPARGLDLIYGESSLEIENAKAVFFGENNFYLTLTKISSAGEDYNVNYYYIRCLPARGLDLLYRESSLDIENTCESSLNLP
jgi:hypothetical protein